MIMEEMSFKSIDLCPQTMILLPDPCYQQFRITYPAMTVSSAPASTRRCVQNDREAAVRVHAIEGTYYSSFR